MIDKLLEIVMLSNAEAWATRDRLMIMEHLLSAHCRVTSEMIENYQPSEEIRESFRAEREESVKRVFATLYDLPDPRSD